MTDTSDLFVAPDGYGEPTIWQDYPAYPDRPQPLTTRHKVGNHRLWALLTATLEERS